MKYLVIDDNPNIRKIICQTIRNEGDSFIECSDGDKALEAYKIHLPDFVFMDIRMKNMNGILSTKKICEQFPGAQIIIVTEYDKPSFRNAAMEAGAIAFFSKENLLEIKKFLESNREFLLTKIK